MIYKKMEIPIPVPTQEELLKVIESEVGKKFPKGLEDENGHLILSLYVDCDNCKVRIWSHEFLDVGFVAGDGFAPLDLVRGGTGNFLYPVPGRKKYAADYVFCAFARDTRSF